MDGKRIREYWSNEMQALLDTYKQFQVLIPAKNRNGADHNGEDGRYVETLIREYLKRYLPKDLEVLTGFILRPAVKTGLKNKCRQDQQDMHSTQLDIIVYDSAKYPIFQRFGESVIVPPEGVVGIISVKKHLHDTDVTHELSVLKKAATLCKCENDKNVNIRGPFLALVAMDSFEKKEKCTEDWIFAKMQQEYKSEEDYFDDLIGYIGALSKWSIFKKRPKTGAKAEYIFFDHTDEEQHIGFQFLLTGLLSVYYDETRNFISSVANGNKKKIQEAIKRFKNEDYPSIVVTVDLLTTGIDVPSISTLVFMRRVKSRILFEQMLGRATRLCKEIHKTHFEIYDPVGVYDALEDVSTMKPVVANPATTFTQLLDSLQGMEDEAHVQNQINQVIAKLQRKKKNIDSKTMEHFIDMSGGMDPTQFVVDLQNRKPEDAKKRLLAYYDLFKMLQESKINGGRPVVISDKEDELISHTRGYGNQDARPEDYLDAFSNYVQTNINEIAALKIICTRPRELTRDSLKSLLLTLDREGYTVQQLNTAISQLTNEEMAADIISLIRRYAIGSVLISHEARIRKAVDRLRKAHTFTMQEQNWIKRI